MSTPCYPHSFEMLVCVANTNCSLCSHASLSTVVFLHLRMCPCCRPLTSQQEYESEENGAHRKKRSHPVVQGFSMRVRKTPTRIIVTASLASLRFLGSEAPRVGSGSRIATLRSFFAPTHEGNRIHPTYQAYLLSKYAAPAPGCRV